MSKQLKQVTHKYGCFENKSYPYNEFISSGSTTKKKMDREEGKEGEKRMEKGKRGERKEGTRREWGGGRGEREDECVSKGA